MHHEHRWAQDRAKTPATVGREKLLEPMVCRDCHATGHQDHTGGVSSVEMRLSPDSPPMRPGRFQGFTVCLLCYRLLGPSQEVWLSRENDGARAVTRPCCYPICRIIDEQKRNREPLSGEELEQQLEQALDAAAPPCGRWRLC